jgi:hypothetical protein
VYGASDYAIDRRYGAIYVCLCMLWSYICVLVYAMELHMCAGAIDLLYMSIVFEIAGNETKISKK